MRFKNPQQRKAVMSKLRKRGLIRPGEKVIAYGSEGAYHRFRLRPPTQFQPSSFRTIQPKGATHKRVIGRPWNKTTTETQAILVPKSQMKFGGKAGWIDKEKEDIRKDYREGFISRRQARSRIRAIDLGGKTSDKWSASGLKYSKGTPSGSFLQLNAEKITMGKRGGKTIDKTENIPYDYRYAKTKQINLPRDPQLLSKFATGRYSYGKRGGKRYYYIEGYDGIYPKVIRKWADSKEEAIQEAKKDGLANVKISDLDEGGKRRR